MPNDSSCTNCGKFCMGVKNPNHVQYLSYSAIAIETYGQTRNEMAIGSHFLRFTRPELFTSDTSLKSKHDILVHNLKNGWPIKLETNCNDSQSQYR